jgi:hypothetical protein
MKRAQQPEEGMSIEESQHAGGQDEEEKLDEEE